jgi:hypothetical protein
MLLQESAMIVDDTITNENMDLILDLIGDMTIEINSILTSKGLEEKTENSDGASSKHPLCFRNSEAK